MIISELFILGKPREEEENILLTDALLKYQIF
jgi:hypothetical protein